MSSQFGFISRLTFLQTWASWLVAMIPPAVAHNIGKYQVLNKVHYLTAVDNTPGDYLEFGVFQGSSFCHSVRCVKKYARFNSDMLDTKFYGFDSFGGFGDLSQEEQHSFFVDDNFTTSLESTEKRVRKVAGDLFFRLVPGFFETSLAEGPGQFGIQKAKIIMIDCDTYSAASTALDFCRPIVQQGTIFVLDDYFYYRGNQENGEMRAFSEFVAQTGIEVRELCTYGMGSIVYIVSSLGSYDKTQWDGATTNDQLSE